MEHQALQQAMTEVDPVSGAVFGACVLLGFLAWTFYCWRTRETPKDTSLLQYPLFG
jgi:hypothetical protein